MSPRRREAPPGPTESARLGDELRDRILSGELAAGTPLREEALAADTGLSRHTVRTALARLTTERLVVQEPYKGVYVTSFTAADALALQQLRCALEAEAVRLTREHHGNTWPDAITAPIQRAVTELGNVARTNPDHWPTVAAAHAAVHRAVVTVAASPRILEAYTRLDSEMLLMLVNLRPNYSAIRVAEDHHDYLDQMQTEGEAAVRRHLDHGIQQVRPRSQRDTTSPA